MESALNLITEKFHEASDNIEDAQNVGNAERLISLLAGVALTFYAMQRKETLLGKGLTLVGGVLISRGTTGVCPVNKVLGRNSLLA